MISSLKDWDCSMLPWKEASLVPLVPAVLMKGIVTFSSLKLQKLRSNVWVYILLERGVRTEVTRFQQSKRMQKWKRNSTNSEKLRVIEKAPVLAYPDAWRSMGISTQWLITPPSTLQKQASLLWTCKWLLCKQLQLINSKQKLHNSFVIKENIKTNLLLG